VLRRQLALAVAANEVVGTTAGHNRPFHLVSGSVRDTRGLGSARTPKGVARRPVAKSTVAQVANSGRAVPCLD
jgi:hypothetical protein